jgi:hypothetical protein
MHQQQIFNRQTLSFLERVLIIQFFKKQLNLQYYKYKSLPILFLNLKPKKGKSQKRKTMKHLMKQVVIKVPKKVRKVKKRKRQMIYQNLRNGQEAQS